MRKYRIDYELRGDVGIEPNTFYAVLEDNDPTTIADIVRDFYTDIDHEDVVSFSIMTIPTKADGLSTQLSFFDEKPYADGGLVAPEQIGLASAASGQIGLASGQIGGPAADYVDFKTDPKLEEAIRMIDNDIWQSMIKDGIRGNK